jgi:voltage-gated potassium channel
MAGITGIYVALALVEDTSPPGLNWATAVVAIVALALLAEFIARIADAPDKIGYLSHHWIDLVTCIPLIGPLRVLRFLRLLRFLKVAVGMRRLARGHAATQATWLLWPFLLLFWAWSAYALWTYEHEVNPVVRDFGSALYEAFLTASTLGYGAFQPVTPEGKVIAGLIVFVAVGLVGLTSARLTAFWMGQKDDTTVALERIEHELSQLKRLLEEQPSETNEVEGALLSGSS